MSSPYNRNSVFGRYSFVEQEKNARITGNLSLLPDYSPRYSPLYSPTTHPNIYPVSNSPIIQPSNVSNSPMRDIAPFNQSYPYWTGESLEEQRVREEYEEKAQARKRQSYIDFQNERKEREAFHNANAQRNLRETTQPDPRPPYSRKPKPWELQQLELLTPDVPSGSYDFELNLREDINNMGNSHSKEKKAYQQQQRALYHHVNIPSRYLAPLASLEAKEQKLNQASEVINANTTNMMDTTEEKKVVSPLKTAEEIAANMMDTTEEKEVVSPLKTAEEIAANMMDTTEEKESPEEIVKEVLRRLDVFKEMIIDGTESGAQGLRNEEYDYLKEATFAEMALSRPLQAYQQIEQQFNAAFELGTPDQHGELINALTQLAQMINVSRLLQQRPFIVEEGNPLMQVIPADKRPKVIKALREIEKLVFQRLDRTIKNTTQQLNQNLHQEYFKQAERLVLDTWAERFLTEPIIPLLLREFDTPELKYDNETNRYLASSQELFADLYGDVEIRDTFTELYQKVILKPMSSTQGHQLIANLRHLIAHMNQDQGFQEDLNVYANGHYNLKEFGALTPGGVHGIEFPKTIDASKTRIADIPIIVMFLQGRLGEMIEQARHGARDGQLTLEGEAYIKEIMTTYRPLLAYIRYQEINYRIPFPARPGFEEQWNLVHAPTEIERLQEEARLLEMELPPIINPDIRQRFNTIRGQCEVDSNLAPLVESLNLMEDFLLDSRNDRSNQVLDAFQNAIQEASRLIMHGTTPIAALDKVRAEIFVRAIALGPNDKPVDVLRQQISFQLERFRQGLNPSGVDTALTKLVLYQIEKQTPDFYRKFMTIPRQLKTQMDWLKLASVCDRIPIALLNRPQLLTSEMKKELAQYHMDWFPPPQQGLIQESDVNKKEGIEVRDSILYAYHLPEYGSAAFEQRVKAVESYMRTDVHPQAANVELLQTLRAEGKESLDVLTEDMFEQKLIDEPNEKTAYRKVIEWLRESLDNENVSMTDEPTLTAQQSNYLERFLNLQFGPWAQPQSLIPLIRVWNQFKNERSTIIPEQLKELAYILNQDTKSQALVEDLLIEEYPETSSRPRSYAKKQVEQLLKSIPVEERKTAVTSRTTTTTEAVPLREEKKSTFQQQIDWSSFIPYFESKYAYLKEEMQNPLTIMDPSDEEEIDHLLKQFRNAPAGAYLSEDMREFINNGTRWQALRVRTRRTAADNAEAMLRQEPLPIRVPEIYPAPAGMGQPPITQNIIPVMHPPIPQIPPLRAAPRQPPPPLNPAPNAYVVNENPMAIEPMMYHAPMPAPPPEREVPALPGPVYQAPIQNEPPRMNPPMQVEPAAAAAPVQVPREGAGGLRGAGAVARPRHWDQEATAVKAKRPRKDFGVIPGPDIDAYRTLEQLYRDFPEIQPGYVRPDYGEVTRHWAYSFPGKASSERVEVVGW